MYDGGTSLYLLLVVVVFVIILKIGMLNRYKWAGVKLPLLFIDLSPYI